jgi:hypothetical protein
MKLYAKLGGLSLLILISVALICYSPVTKSIYEDWKKERQNAREEEHISSLVAENSGVKDFTREGGRLIPSNLNVQLKLLSKDQVGAIVRLSPVHPVRATRDDSYQFTLLFEDKDGFDLQEIVVHEWEMTPVIGEGDLPDSLTFETKVSMPLEQYRNISNLQVAYGAHPGRKELYEQLRELTPAEIIAKQEKDEQEALAAEQERLESLAAEREKAQQEATERERKREEKEQEALAAERLRLARLAAEQERWARLQAEEHQKIRAQQQQRAAAWNQIKQGISRQRVEELLGQPQRVDNYTIFTVMGYEGLSTVKISSSGIVESYSKP